MKRSNRAWILFPAVIVAAAVIGLVVSSWQKEAGLIQPSNGGRAAVAAATAAADLSLGTGAEDYRAYNEALLVAVVARSNAPAMNPADTRLDHLLAQALDYLAASREAWQAELDRSWDPKIQGLPLYWEALHPGVELSGDGPLTSREIREACERQASEVLKRAIDLVS